MRITPARGRHSTQQRAAISHPGHHRLPRADRRIFHSGIAFCPKRRHPKRGRRDDLKGAIETDVVPVPLAHVSARFALGIEDSYPRESWETGAPWKLRL